MNQEQKNTFTKYTEPLGYMVIGASMMLIASYLGYTIIKQLFNI